MTCPHRPTSSRLHPCARLLLASLLAAAGCAGDDSGDSEGTTTSASASDSEGSATEGTQSGTAGTESSATEGSATEGSATEGTTTDGSATAGTTTDPSTTEGSATEGSTTAGTTEETGVEGPSFVEIYEQVIVAQNCNSGYCHGAGAGGLLLTDEATSYASLVGAEANAPMCGSTLLVAPGSPEESVLWYRTRPAALDEGMEPCAPKMPEGSDGLEEAEGGMLRDWIEGGAPQ